MIKVFVTYAHENDEHLRRVEDVATVLQTNGMTVFLDRWREDRRNDWNQLTTTEIESADYVVAVVSEKFRAAADGTAPAGESPGIGHELSIVRDLLHEDRENWFRRIIPLVLPPWTTGNIPRFLQPATATHVVVSDVTESALAPLLSILSERPADRPPRAIRRVIPASVRLMPAERRRAIGGSALALITVAAVAVACQGYGDGDVTGVGNGQGNSVNQTFAPCQHVGDNSSCEFRSQEDLDDLDDATSSEKEFKAELAREATGEPSGSGPWPFVIVDTMDGDDNVGLFARATNTERGDRLGYAFNHDTIWADCEATSNFTPPTSDENDMGPRWLRVRWAPTNPKLSSVSDPGEDERAWMYRGFLVPLNHNGHIPACASSPTAD